MCKMQAGKIYQGNTGKMKKRKTKKMITTELRQLRKENYLEFLKQLNKPKEQIQ